MCARWWSTRVSRPGGSLCCSGSGYAVPASGVIVYGLEKVMTQGRHSLAQGVDELFDDGLVEGQRRIVVPQHHHQQARRVLRQPEVMGVGVDLADARQGHVTAGIDDIARWNR